MRASLDDPSLTRQAGRFVWLEVDFDKPVNQPFLKQRGASYTPTLYVLDPVSERPTASHIGGMTLAELDRFLDEGERGFQGKALSPADSALARGEELLGRGESAAAAGAIREAMGLAPPDWRERWHAVGALTWALMGSGEAQASAETAAVEAPRMPRDSRFARVVLAGFTCSNSGGNAAWARNAGAILEPLAEEALTVRTALRDHRFQLYQQLIQAADARGDSVSTLRWSTRWLDEIDAIAPKDDNERSALDIARIDALVDTSQALRVIPALKTSVREMPDNYNASLRLAQAQNVAKEYDDAIVACDHGLDHVTGPLGRSWLQRTKAEGLRGKGDMAGARDMLQRALESARAIGNTQVRDGNIARISREIAALDQPGK